MSRLSALALTTSASNIRFALNTAASASGLSFAGGRQGANEMQGVPVAWQLTIRQVGVAQKGPRGIIVPDVPDVPMRPRDPNAAGVLIRSETRGRPSMPQYHHKAWHHLIGAAAAVLLLAVATAVPFGASARDTGVPSAKVGARANQDAGARKAEPVKRAKPVGPIRARTGETGKRAKPAGPISKPAVPGGPQPVRADDPAKKGGKCTPQQCQALKDACLAKHAQSCSLIDRAGTRFQERWCARKDDSCNSISCEGAC